MIPPKPSNKHAVACVGPLVDNVLVGCRRTPLRFVVAPANNGFGLGEIEDADLPSIKVCGVCNRHIDEITEALREDCPVDLDPMVFRVPELLETWDEFFTDLSNTMGAEGFYVNTGDRH